MFDAAVGKAATTRPNVATTRHISGFKNSQDPTSPSTSAAPGRPTALHSGLRTASTPFGERRGAVAGRLRWPSLFRYFDVILAVTVLVAVLIASNASGVQPRDVNDFLALRVTVKNLLLITTFCLSWMGSFTAFGLYESGSVHSSRSENTRIVAACCVGSISVLLFPFTSHGTGAVAFSYDDAVAFWAVATLAALVARKTMRWADRTIQQRIVKRVIIIGTGPRAVELARQLRGDANVTTDILGCIDTRAAAAFGDDREQRLGFLDEIDQTLMHTVVDEVLIALPIKSHYDEIESVIRACEHAGVQSKYLADVFDPRLARPRLEVSGNFPLMAMRVVHDDYRLLIKRAIDIACVVAVLPVVLPIGLCVAAAVRLTSPGDVFFNQERYGLGKRRFRMHKFRTMVTDAEALQSQLELMNEASGPVFKMTHDPRVTRIGAFLRRTSLDELPQLWNIVKGEMSLVGPRPLPLRDVSKFEESWLMRRFSVLPGLTCLWQIGGRSAIGFDKWVELDLKYIDQWSLRLDFAVLLKTVPAVLRGTGAT